MPPDDYLKEKLERLKKLLKQLRDNLKRLDDAWVATDSIANKIALEANIKNTENEIKRVEMEISELERKDNIQNVRRALLRLDYEHQERRFWDIIDQQSICAFLICTPANYGQTWLMRRLLVEEGIFYKGEASPLKVVLPSYFGCNIESIWGQLAMKVGLEEDVSVPEILNRIRQLHETQNVCIQIELKERMPSGFMTDLIEEIWGELIAAIDSTLSAGSLLLMFLFDYNDPGIHEFPFAVDYVEPWNPRLPVKLPDIERFTRDLLIHWIKNSQKDLKRYVNTLDKDIDAILGEGIPMPVLEEICKRCNCTLKQVEQLC